VSADRLRAATAALALLGAAIAAYLGYTRLRSTSIMCPTSGCAVVDRSSYSTLAGIPVAFLGFGTYVVLAVLSLRRTARTLHLQAVVLAAALGFSLYLLVAQVVLIGAVCVWCLSSDATIVVLGVVIVLRYRACAVPATASADLARVRIGSSTSRSVGLPTSANS
jgi:uncharacterized membrane protein